VHYVVGDRLLVRAVDDISAGDEVSVCYLGREDFSPAATRQQLLHQRFGFQCGCPRCQLEARLPARVSSALRAVHAEVKEVLQPRFTAAHEEEVGQGHEVATARL
jgi:hypothetical protein